MATNELLPFANGEDANVLPTNQWEALTDILENGFQSGIARSEQVNRVLAQGAVASYVLGQLIVDQLNKDATLDNSALYQNLILALQENAKDACLPLAGGTMTGSITSYSDDFMRGGDNFARRHISSGVDWYKGAYIALDGCEVDESVGDAVKGKFTIGANNGTEHTKLLGYPDGTLHWNERPVLSRPEYGNGIDLNQGSQTASNNGLVVCFAYTSGWGGGDIYVNGACVGRQFGKETGGTMYAFVKKGDTINLTTSNATTWWATLYPL